MVSAVAEVGRRGLVGEKSARAQEIPSVVRAGQQAADAASSFVS